jgi:hypothetical protein
MVNFRLTNILMRCWVSPVSLAFIVEIGNDRLYRKTTALETDLTTNSKLLYIHREMCFLSLALFFISFHSHKPPSFLLRLQVPDKA